MPLSLPTIRILLLIALQNEWCTNQLNIPMVFLNGKLDTEVYIKLPNYESGALNLKKSFYGLHSVPSKWNERLNVTVEKYGLVRSLNNFCLWV